MSSDRSLQQRVHEIDNLLLQLQDMDKHKAFLRDEIKHWEAAFTEKSGREPGVADKKKIKLLYSDYSKIRIDIKSLMSIIETLSNQLNEAVTEEGGNDDALLSEAIISFSRLYMPSSATLKSDDKSEGRKEKSQSKGGAKHVDIDINDVHETATSTAAPKQSNRPSTSSSRHHRPTLLSHENSSSSTSSSLKTRLAAAEEQQSCTRQNIKRWEDEFARENNRKPSARDKHCITALYADYFKARGEFARVVKAIRANERGSQESIDVNLHDDEDGDDKQHQAKPSSHSPSHSHSGRK